MHYASAKQFKERQRKTKSPESTMSDECFCFSFIHYTKQESERMVHFQFDHAFICPQFIWRMHWTINHSTSSSWKIERARRRNRGRGREREREKTQDEEKKKKRKETRHSETIVHSSCFHCYENEVPRELANVFYSSHTFFYSLCGQEKAQFVTLFVSPAGGSTRAPKKGTRTSSHASEDRKNNNKSQLLGTICSSTGGNWRSEQKANSFFLSVIATYTGNFNMCTVDLKCYFFTHFTRHRENIFYQPSSFKKAKRDVYTLCRVNKNITRNLCVNFK